ncbi:MAG: hypothetical protein EBR02_09895 [Alphaproteobacteria bacterium]|nr:hypothetical protein [Alphaproteobacteria bacterium]
MSITLLAAELRGHNRDRFLQAMFVPPPAREVVIAIYALEMELAHVHGMVKEEMIGHIRYAWWGEAIEGLFDGQPARGHPVLEALRPYIIDAKIPKADLLALVAAYREAFPQLPQNGAQLADGVVEKTLEALSPKSIKRWARAGKIIAKHRTRHPRGKNGWLAVKLLLS